MQINIRQALPKDLDNVLQIFRETIETVNAKDYSQQQIKAWSGGADKRERWLSKISDQYFLVAIVDEKLAGFGSITKTGYLDFMYVHKDYQRMGIAKEIYNHLERFAKEHKLDKIRSDVSITAKPFFEAQGFKQIQQQTVMVEGIALANFKMGKNL